MFKSWNAPQSVRKRSLVGVHHLFAIDEPPSLIQCPDDRNDFRAPQFSAEIDNTDAFVTNAEGRMNNVGLMRSQSFPPEGWYKTTSKYILKVSKTSLKAEINERPLTDTDLEHEEDVGSRNATPTSKLVNVLCEQTSPRKIEAMEEQEQCIVMNVASEQVCGMLAQEAALSSNQASANRDNVASSSGGTFTNVAHDGFQSQSSSSLMPALAISPRKIALPVLVASEPIGFAVGHCVPASTFPPSGKVLVCGQRREMEDAASIVPSFISVFNERRLSAGAQPENQTRVEWHYFGVFDGHGGSQASVYCVDRLHHLVAAEYMDVFGFGALENRIGDDCNLAWTEVMKSAFSKMDKEVGGVCPNALLDRYDDAIDGGCLCCEDVVAPENVGTTAVVALVGLTQVVVANCGDSRAVLARGGQAIPLSRDHKPELEDETKRIEAAGGRVICWDGYRVGGFLALSRAIGDRYLKRYVISEPEVRCIQRMDDDECLILASDGLWDVLGNEFACEVAQRSLTTLRKKYELRISPPGEDAAAAAVAALLVKLAYGRGSQDNISVVVVDLKSCKSSQS